MHITYAQVRASEAAHLSEFATDTFNQTYSPSCRAADVQAYMALSLSPSALLRDLTSAGTWVFAAMIDEQWAGYTHLRLAAVPAGAHSQHGATAGGATPLEIARFYVAREWHGQGVAAGLLNTVLTHAQAERSPTVWLSVWQENARAIAFYEKSQFRCIGTTNFLMGNDLQDDFIMERGVPQVLGTETPSARE